MEATSPDCLVLTVGHLTHAIDRFVDLLRQNGVTAIAAVRSAPYSRHQSQFNLFRLLGLPDQDLFRSRADIVEEAYAIQSKRIAYVNERLAARAAEARQ
jgi:hypothetical protein